jgi:hypothetical protein
MAMNNKLILKIFSPRIVAKAVVTMDKSTAVIVSAFWLAALVTLIMAVFAVHGAVSAKKAAAGAQVAEPVLPVISNTSLSAIDIQKIMDRMQHQFPDIRFDTGQNQSIVIRSNDGSKFHQWITALSYVDTMEPQFRWMINDFCVGACGNQDMMKATVSGHKVVFSLPQHS